MNPFKVRAVKFDGTFNAIQTLCKNYIFFLFFFTLMWLLFSWKFVRISYRWKMIWFQIVCICIQEKGITNRQNWAKKRQPTIFQLILGSFFISYKSVKLQVVSMRPNETSAQIFHTLTRNHFKWQRIRRE